MDHQFFELPVNLDIETKVILKKLVALEISAVNIS